MDNQQDLYCRKSVARNTSEEPQVKVLALTKFYKNIYLDLFEKIAWQLIYLQSVIKERRNCKEVISGISGIRYLLSTALLKLFYVWQYGWIFIVTVFPESKSLHKYWN